LTLDFLRVKLSEEESSGCLDEPTTNQDIIDPSATKPF